MALCPAVPCCGKTGPSTALPEPGRRPLSCARTFPSQTEQARPPKSSEHFRETLSLVTLEAAGTGDTVASVGLSPQTRCLRLFVPAVRRCQTFPHTPEETILCQQRGPARPSPQCPTRCPDSSLRGPDPSMLHGRSWGCACPPPPPVFVEF